MINYTYLDELSGLDEPGKTPLAFELIELFLAAAPGKLGQIEDALRAGDTESARKAAHSFRSTCLNVGATDLARLCGDFEKGEPAVLASVLANLRAHHRPAAEALEKYKEGKKA